MDIYVISYADSNFREQQLRLSKSINRINSNYKVVEFTPQDIDKEFFSKNESILSNARGGGYWLWKPYIIKKQLDRLNEGDYLFYCDSGAILINKIEFLIKALEDNNQDIMGFQLPLIEKQWTKKELFINMQCDEDFYYNSNQLLASFILIKKSNYSLKFVDEYLRYSSISENITDYKDKLVIQEDSFIDHRHDQSIFSLLYKKNNLKPFVDPSQFGNLPEGYSGLKNFRINSNMYNKLYTLENQKLFRVEKNSYPKYPVIVFHLRKGNHIKLRLKYTIKILLKRIKD